MKTFGTTLAAALARVLVVVALWGCAGPRLATPARPRNPQVEPLGPTSDPSPSPSTFRDLLPIAPDPQRSLGADQADWYRDSVGYHIWINAFHDSNGDGVGDLRGVTQKLDYLQRLGVDLIWLSPFFESSSEAINLHMYDTTDHTRVDPRFGTNQDVDELLSEAHRRGIRVIFDYVPNHVSHKHPWFQRSAANEEGWRDWFVWRPRAGSQRGPWGQQVWHRLGGAFYYGVFWSGMPDVNYRHQPAKDAMANVAITWLNRGFDGMRVDAIPYLYEDIRSVEGGYADQPETLEYYQALRSQILDRYSDFRDRQGRPYHKMMVAENWTNDVDNLVKYIVQDDTRGFHMTLDFPFAYMANHRDGRALAQYGKLVSDLQPQAVFATFLSNHDNVVVRPYSRHGDSHIRTVVALQLLWLGVPFLYYGNEVGMPDAERFAGAAHADRRHRQPIDWRKVEAQIQDPNSLWNFHRELIALRKSRPSLRRGAFVPASLDARSITFFRALDDEITLIVLNFSDQDMKSSVEFKEGGPRMRMRRLWPKSPPAENRGNKLETEVPAGGVQVWEVIP